LWFVLHSNSNIEDEKLFSSSKVIILWYQTLNKVRIYPTNFRIFFLSYSSHVQKAFIILKHFQQSKNRRPRHDAFDVLIIFKKNKEYAENDRNHILFVDVTERATVKNNINVRINFLLMNKGIDIIKQEKTVLF
jgi:hypothetical protein